MTDTANAKDIGMESPAGVGSTTQDTPDPSTSSYYSMYRNYVYPYVITACVVIGRGVTTFIPLVSSSKSFSDALNLPLNKSAVEALIFSATLLDCGARISSTFAELKKPAKAYERRWDQFWGDIGIFFAVWFTAYYGSSYSYIPIASEKCLGSRLYFPLILSLTAPLGFCYYALPKKYQKRDTNCIFSDFSIHQFNEIKKKMFEEKAASHGSITVSTNGVQFPQEANLRLFNKIQTLTEQNYQQTGFTYQEATVINEFLTNNSPIDLNQEPRIKTIPWYNYWIDWLGSAGYTAGTLYKTLHSIFKAKQDAWNESSEIHSEKNMAFIIGVTTICLFFSGLTLFNQHKTKGRKFLYLPNEGALSKLFTLDNESPIAQGLHRFLASVTAFLSFITLLATGINYVQGCITFTSFLVDMCRMEINVDELHKLPGESLGPNTYLAIQIAAYTIFACLAIPGVILYYNFNSTNLYKHMSGFLNNTLPQTFCCCFNKYVPEPTDSVGSLGSYSGSDGAADLTACLLEQGTSNIDALNNGGVNIDDPTAPLLDPVGLAEGKPGRPTFFHPREAPSGKGKPAMENLA